MPNFFYVYLLVLVLFVIIRKVIVIIHEFGHAISVIILTNEKATIYIGSYGDSKNCFHINLEFLDIWLKKNPLLWKLGLCKPSSKQISINSQIIYTLMGPLSSFIIASIFIFISYSFNLNDYIKLISIIFFILSIIDLITNLTPKSTPIKLFDGSITYNDGYQLKKLFNYKKLPKEYLEAIELYDNQKYNESSIILNNLLSKGFKEEKIYSLAIISLLQVKNYNQAKEITDDFIKHGKLEFYDYTNIGISYSMLNFHEESLSFYNKSIELNPTNSITLNNKGYTLNQLERFEEAIILFDKAIEIDNLAYSYCNRGYSKIKIGKIEEGFQDINYSLKLDKNNSYGYRNLGIYHLEKQEYPEALELFLKAKTLDNSTHLIDDLIKKTECFMIIN